MKLIRITLWFLVLLSFSRCGQTVTGTYTGQEVVTFSNLGGNLNPAPITVSLTLNNNDMIVGSIQSTFGSGTINGRPSGEFGIAYSLIQSYQAQVPGYTGAIVDSTRGAFNCGTYVGKVTLTNNQLTGTLNLTQPAAAVPPSPYVGGPSATQTCPSSRTITVNRQQ